MRGGEPASSVCLVRAPACLRGLGVLAALAALSLACAGQSAGAPASGTCVKAGCVAPNFTLKSTAGPTVELYQLRGRPVMINFWATWCPACVAEMPSIEKVYSLYQPVGLMVLGVNLEESAGDAAAFAQQRNLSFPILLDTNGQVGSVYQITAIPASFFVNPDGVIRNVHVGMMTQTEIQGIVGVQTSPTQAPKGTGKAVTLGPATATAAGRAVTPAAEGLEGCVTSAGLNVRAGPSDDAPVVDWLRNSKCVPFDARTADSTWLRLAGADAKTGQARWVAAKFIALKGDGSTLPVAK